MGWAAGAAWVWMESPGLVWCGGGRWGVVVRYFFAAGLPLPLTAGLRFAAGLPFGGAAALALEGTSLAHRAMNWREKPSSSPDRCRLAMAAHSSGLRVLSWVRGRVSMGWFLSDVVMVSMLMISYRKVK